MKLFHGTYKRNRKSIEQYGLNREKQKEVLENTPISYEDISKIDDFCKLNNSSVWNFIIDSLAPPVLPKWMRKSEAIYLTIYEDYLNYWKPTYGDRYGVILDSNDLNMERLYVLDITTPNLSMILDTQIEINKYHRLNKEIPIDLQKEQYWNVIMYWCQLIPFKDYVKEPNKYKVTLNKYCPELLYFNDIEPKNLIFINDDCKGLWESDTKTNLFGSYFKYENNDGSYMYIDI